MQGDERVVTVCSACLRASCWHGDFMCEQHATAGTVERRVSDLDALGREHPSHYSREKIAEVCGVSHG